MSSGTRSPARAMRATLPPSGSSNQAVNIGCGMPSTKPISNAMSHWIAISSCGSAAAMASTSRSIASS